MAVDAFTPDPKTWYILSFAHSGHVLGAQSFSHDNGTPLAQTAYARLGHQHWGFVEVGPGAYQPIMRSSSGTKSFGRALVVWDRGSDGAKQHWAFEPLAGGGYRLRNLHENRVMAVEAASPRAGANIVFAAAGSSGEGQRVDIVALPPAEPFEPEPEAWYTIRFAHSGHLLEVQSWRCGDGSAVVQEPDAEDHNQQWSFERVEPGWYILHPRHCPKRVLEVPGGSQQPSEKLTISTRHGGSSQQWKIEPAFDGYQIRSRASGGALSIQDASIESGARLIQQELFGTSSADNARQHRHVRFERVCEPLPDTPARALRIDTLAQLLRLPLLRCFYGREVTIETWVRPRELNSNGHEILVELAENGTRFSLQRNDGKLLVRLYRDDRTHTLCESDWRAFAGGEWTHVAVTVAHENKEDRYPLELYVDGTRVATGRTGNQSSKDAHHLFGAKVQSRCVIGSQYGGGRRFRGELADVRIWRRKRSSDDIADRRHYRLRGNNQHLAAYYFMDAVVDGLVRDQGVSRLHAAVGDGESVAAEGLLLGATVGRVPQVESSAKLVREWLPVASLTSEVRSSLDLDVAWQGAADTGTPSASELGRVEGDMVELSLFDAELTLRSADGYAVVDRLCKIVLPHDEVAIIDEPDGSVHAEVWRAGYHMVRASEAGTVQLRFVARTAEGPRLYARHEQMPRAVWTTVSTDVGIYAAMHQVSAADLLAPADGRPSPLPANTSEADAKGVAQMVAALAWVGTPGEVEPGTNEPQTRGLFGSVSNLIDNIGDAFEDGASVAWSGTQSAGQLVGNAATLASAAMDCVPGIGKSAIVNRIAEATQVGAAVSSLEAGASYVIQIVGETAGEYWRVLVTEVSEAAAALGAFFKRIGASIKALLEYLASLFSWRRFLAASDDVYDEVLGALAGVRDEVAKLDSVASKLDPYLVPGPSSPNFDLSINEMIAMVGKPPKLDELDLILGYARKIFKSTKLDLNLPTPAISANFANVDIDALAEAFANAVPDMVYSPSRLFDDPVRPLCEMPAQLWAAVREVIDTIWSALLGLIDVVFDAIADVLTKRLRIPWLTRMIEDTILCVDGKSRELNVLRLFALLTAIPSVLSGASDDGEDDASADADADADGDAGPVPLHRSPPEFEQDRTYTEPADQEPPGTAAARRNYRRLSRASSGLGITNWVLWTIRALVEAKESTRADFGDALAVLQSAVLGAAAGVELYRVGPASTHKPQEQHYIQAAFMLNAIDAICSFGSAYVTEDKQLESLFENVGSYGVGAGWIANAGCFLGLESLTWESAYWGGKWILDGTGKELRRLQQLEDLGKTAKSQLGTTASAVALVSTGLHILYLSRAGGA